MPAPQSTLTFGSVTAATDLRDDARVGLGDGYAAADQLGRLDGHEVRPNAETSLTFSTLSAQTIEIMPVLSAKVHAFLDVGDGHAVLRMIDQGAGDAAVLERLREHVPRMAAGLDGVDVLGEYLDVKSLVVE